MLKLKLDLVGILTINILAVRVGSSAAGTHGKIDWITFFNISATQVHPLQGLLVTAQYVPSTGVHSHAGPAATHSNVTLTHRKHNFFREAEVVRSNLDVGGVVGRDVSSVNVAALGNIGEVSIVRIARWIREQGWKF